MKTELQKRLATLNGSICIQTIWEHDDHASFTEHGMTEPGGCFHGEDPDDWQAWQTEIRASVIQDGEMVSASAYLGGTWERYGDKPEESNPTISGYENQMTAEALEELAKLAPDHAEAINLMVAAICPAA
jgi:hypothetical protein